MSEYTIHQNSGSLRQRKLIYGRDAYYHVVTRTAFGRFILDRQEKEVFVAILQRQAKFCGVDVLTYCVMSNHVHLLVRVPEVADVDAITDAEIMRRYRILYSQGGSPAAPHPDVMAQILEKGGEERTVWRERLLDRMHCLDGFMRELKQRFSIWYNKTHQNKGTLWAERYRHTIVEPTYASLSTVAAYIDLNPVRAQIVEQPEEYRHCGYGAAIGGDAWARAGLCGIPGGPQGWEGFLIAYRVLLYGKGGRNKGAIDKDQGRIEAEKVAQVIREGGQVEPHELLRLRLRYISDGLAIGSEEFVHQVRGEILGATHSSSAKRPAELPGCDGDLCSLRDLKKDAIG